MPLPTEEQWKYIADDFYTKWNIPNCLGAINGKHVNIQAPANSVSLFYNYKSFFSLVLLAIASGDYRFVIVDIGGYGSKNDSGLLNSTNFFKQLNSRSLNIPPSAMLPNDQHCVVVPHFFIGDNAFPLFRDLLQPFPRNQLSNEAKIYNYRLCRGRRLVENAFGILAQRCHIYQFQIYVGPDMAEVVVSDYLMNKINFVGGDKLLPVFKYGFLRSEENVFPAIFLHTKCVQFHQPPGSNISHVPSCSGNSTSHLAITLANLLQCDCRHACASAHILLYFNVIFTYFTRL